MSARSRDSLPALAQGLVADLGQLVAGKVDVDQLAAFLLAHQHLRPQKTSQGRLRRERRTARNSADYYARVNKYHSSAYALLLFTAIPC